MKSGYRDLLVSYQEAEVLITGISYDLGCSCGQGAKQAPQVIRDLSKFLPPFSRKGEDLRSIKLYDCGDIDVDNLEQIYQQTIKQIYHPGFKIFLGGDHSISIPLQKSFIERAQEDYKIPVIIHLDAHPDICQSYLGNKYSHACPNARALDHGLKDQNLVIIGVRGFEAEEVEFFKAHPQIKVYPADLLLTTGIDQILDQIINSYDDRHRIYLSYDIDINDPAYAPGTGTPEAFGLPSLMVLTIIEKLIANLPVDVLDIVEVSPPLDTNNITSWLALKTLYEVFNILIKKRKA